MKYLSLLFLVLFTCSCQITADAQTARYARVISENANMREAPSPTGESSEIVPEGTFVKVLDEKLPWYIVRIRDRVGWMHGNTLEFVGVEAPISVRGTQQTITPDYTPLTAPTRRREDSYEAPRVDRVFIRGPRGGCYYISSSGRKVYGDRSLCN